MNKILVALLAVLILVLFTVITQHPSFAQTSSGGPVVASQWAAYCPSGWTDTQLADANSQNLAVEEGSCNLYTCGSLRRLCLQLQQPAGTPLTNSPISASWFSSCPSGWTDTQLTDCDANDGHQTNENSCGEGGGAVRLCLIASGASLNASWSGSCPVGGTKLTDCDSGDGHDVTEDSCNGGGSSQQLCLFAAPLPCSDGTTVNTCSATKPKYCTSSGTLTDLCSTCGCSSGQACNTATNTCYTPDTTPPSVTASVSPTSPKTTDTVTIFASASDASGVGSISLYINGSLARTCTSATSCAVSTVFAAGTYSSYAKATDNAGNTAQVTLSFTVTQADTTPPTVVASLTPSTGITTATTVTIGVSASDESGVVYTGIYINDIKVTECQSSACYYSAQFPAGTHSLIGTAYDRYGNFGSVTKNFTVTQADTTPPVRSGGYPAGTLPAGTTQTTVILSTNEPATCKYSLTPNTLYNSMTTFTYTGGTFHSFLAGLAPGMTYNFYVKCADTSGNTNPDDYVISFTVAQADTTPPTILVTHSPYTPTVNDTVYVYAVSTDAGSSPAIDLYVDGTKLQTTCTSYQNAAGITVTCHNISKFSIGTHTYYATATDAAGNKVRDPATGTKGFLVQPTTIRRVSGTFTLQGSESVITNVDGQDYTIKLLGVTSSGSAALQVGSTTETVSKYAISTSFANLKIYVNDTKLISTTDQTQNYATLSIVTLSVSHSPAYPTTSDLVTITATASPPLGGTVYIFAVGSKSCSDQSACTYSKQLSAGTYEYSAEWDVGSHTIFDPPGGAKKTFTVTQAGTNATTCTDSDGGKNYYVKGVVRYGNGSYDDFCDIGSLGEPVLWEYSCQNNIVTTDGYNCPYGCSNGACLNATQPSITVLSPNGGEIWQKGTTQKIMWSASSSIPKVDIILSCVALPCPAIAVVPYIVIGTPNDGVFEWTVGNLSMLGISVNSSYKIVIHGVLVNGSIVVDLSDAPFTISEAALTCAELASSKSDYFQTCRYYQYSHACFNKYTGEYQGCTYGDNYCTVNNTNAANNIACAVNQTGFPDLAAQYIEVKNKNFGQQTWIRVGYTNKGNAVAKQGFVVYFYDNIEYIGQKTVPYDVAPGANDNVYLEGYTFKTPGTHTITAIVDYTNIISESNENNNKIAQSFEITASLSAEVYTDKYQYITGEPVNITAYAYGNQSLLDKLELTAVITRPDGVTEKIPLAATGQVVASSAGGASAASNVSAPSVKYPYYDNYVIFEGMYTPSIFGDYKLNLEGNVALNTYPVTFKVIDRKLLEKYLILNDIGEYKFQSADVQKGSYSGVSYNFYLASYMRNNEPVLTYVMEFNSREDAEKAIEAIKKSEVQTGALLQEDIINNNKVLIYTSVGISNNIVLWTNKNLIVAVTYNLQYYVTSSSPPTCGSGTVNSGCFCHEGQVKEAYSPICPEGVACPAVMYYRCVPLQMPKPVIEAYLVKYPSDLYQDLKKKEVTQDELLEIVMGLEDLKTKFDKLQKDAISLANYYRSIGDVNNTQKFEKVASMFGGAKEMANSIELKIKNNINNPEAIIDEVRNDVIELKALMRRILLVIVGASEEATTASVLQATG